MFNVSEIQRSGYIWLPRQLVLDNEWYKDGNTIRLYVHCLLRANYQDTDYRGIEIRRGQLLTSQESLSNELRLSIQNVRTALNHLKSTNHLTLDTRGRKYTLITIVGYDEILSNKATNETRTIR